MHLIPDPNSIDTLDDVRYASTTPRASTLNSSNSVSNRVFDSKSMAVTHGNLGLNIDVGSGSGVEVGQDESVRRMALHALLKEFCEESLSANQLRHALGMFVVFGIIACLCLK